MTRRGNLPLRYDPIDGPELRCQHCGEWLPITPEFWRTAQNKWDRCLACRREYDRLRAALKRRNPEFRAQAADYQRRYRAWLRREAPDLVLALERERGARRRAAQRERKAA